MTEQDYQSWLKMLRKSIIPRKNGTRLYPCDIVRDLLSHASLDGMTEEDVRICERALIDLESDSRTLRREL